MLLDYDYLPPGRYFLGGYTYAMLSLFLYKCLPNTIYRICIIIVAFFIRFGIILFVIDHALINVTTISMGVVTDLFVIYFFYSYEKTERRIFLSFDEKREEILKFKELLAEYLPIGVLVINLQTLKTLFSNNTFISLSDSTITSDTIPNGTNLNQIIRDQDEQINNYLNSLQVDENIVKNLERGTYDLQSYGINTKFIGLENVINKLVKDGLLVDRAVSLRAVEKTEANPRSFDVTLKKIKWDMNDAITMVLNDITFQEKLIYWKTTNENKDKIIATVSHELRTPLNGIIGLLDMAEKKIVKPEALELTSLCRDNANL